MRTHQAYTASKSSPGSDCDISCRRHCSQRWRVGLSICYRLNGIREELDCFHGPRKSRMLMSQSTAPLTWGLWLVLQNSLVSATVLSQSNWANSQKLCDYAHPEAWCWLEPWTSPHIPLPQKLWDAFWLNMALCSLRVSPDIPSAAWLSPNSSTAHYFIRGVKYKLFIKTHIIGCLTTV